MDEENKKVDEGSSAGNSSKPLAFTIDFGDGRAIDTEKHKSLMEKYKKRHKRGQSLSKLDDISTNSQVKKQPSTGNLPRKSNFQHDDISSDEKSEKCSNGGIKSKENKTKRDNLTLPLKNTNNEKISRSILPCISSPEIELKDISSPELDFISPNSPKVQKLTPSPYNLKPKVLRQHSSPECETKSFNNEENTTEDIDVDKSDTVSDAGTYTLETDNYSEEQKAKMSIDSEFNIEEISVMKKAEDYVQSITAMQEKAAKIKMNEKVKESKPPMKNKSSFENTNGSSVTKDLLTCDTKKNNIENINKPFLHKKLSPILSPTQNFSVVESFEDRVKVMNNGGVEENTSFNKIMFPSLKSKSGISSEQEIDQGSVISITSSGAFRPRSEKEKKQARMLTLTKSAIQVETYTEDAYSSSDNIVHATLSLNKPNNLPNLTTNIINLSENVTLKNNEIQNHSDLDSIQKRKVTNLPPSVGGVSGKQSPTKIPSPVHSNRSQHSRNSSSSLNVDLSDSSLETESYLKPTQNIINSLQQKLSLDSDNESDYKPKILNNDARNLIKMKPTHVRHNSFDDRSLKSNKLEHFQNKNLLIDQTSNLFNQYQNKTHKIQNSPNNSPIRRSSSFSTKNQINLQSKCSNIPKENNLRGTMNFTHENSIQRSASTASIKPNVLNIRRSSASEHQKIDRSQFGDTESSSEEEYEKSCVKKKDITNTRYNRAFSLRRGRLDSDSNISQPKCPNTPEMKRKFLLYERPERAISVDRKPTKTNEIQSRYLLNINRTKNSPPLTPDMKNVPKAGVNLKSGNKPQVFSRTDSGRFSMRANKPPTQNSQRPPRKDNTGNNKFYFHNCPWH